MQLSVILHVIHEKVVLISQKKYWPLIPTAIFLLVVFINGVAIVPESPYQKLATDPFTTRTDIHFQNYFQETLLLPLLAFYLKLTSRRAFNALCMLLILGGFAYFASQVAKRWGALISLIFSALLITSPLTTVLLSWVGMPDALTMVLSIPFLFTNSVWLIFILAIVGTTNHIIFLIASLEILFLRWLAGDKIKFLHLTITIFGGILGWALVRLFLNLNHIEVMSRLEFAKGIGIEKWVDLNTTNLPIAMDSLFNIHWLVIAICLLMFFKHDKRFFVSTIFVLIVNYSITFFSLDTTRVFSLLSWGVLMTVLFHSYRLSIQMEKVSVGYKDQFLKTMLIIGIVSIFAPRYFYWAGEVHATPFYELLKRFFD